MNWSQSLSPKLDADGRRHQLDAALSIDHLNPSFLNFDRENR